MRGFRVEQGQRLMRWLARSVACLLLAGLLGACGVGTPGTGSAPPTSLLHPSPGVTGVATLAPTFRQDMSQVRMVDASTGWLATTTQVGQNVVASRIFHTTNGGLSWMDVTPPTMPVGQLTPSFLSATTAWVGVGTGVFTPSSSQAHFFFTTNGGLSWRVSVLVVTPSAAMPGIQTAFSDTQYGWVLDDTGVAAGSVFAVLSRTTDGGASWVQDPHPLPFPDGPDTFSVTSRSTGWTTGNMGAFTVPVVGRTIDGGATWSEQRLAAFLSSSSVGYTTLPPTFFSAADGLLPVQAAPFSASSSHPLMLDVYVTHNGGVTWQATRPVAAATAAFLTAEQGWATDGTTLSGTTNGGHTWHGITPGGPFQHVTSLDFVSPDSGWAIVQGGSSSALLHTTDGGQSWTIQATGGAPAQS